MVRSLSGFPAIGQPAIRVSPMKTSDLDSVARLEDNCSDYPWSRRLFEVELTSVADSIWLTAEKGHIVVGFAGAMLRGRVLHLMNVAVDDEYRRIGVASRMISQLLEEGTARGAQRSTLEVKHDNTGALSLYRRFGFETTGRRLAYYRDGDDALVLWKHHR